MPNLGYSFATTSVLEDLLKNRLATIVMVLPLLPLLTGRPMLHLPAAQRIAFGRTSPKPATTSTQH